jgi:hypothetical protein
MPVRIPLAVLVLALGLTAGLVALATVSRPASGPAHRPGHGPGHGPTGVPASAGASSESARPRGPLALLHDWDTRRAAAWAAGDTAALARLYTDRSSAGVADVALLGRYTARGLVVRGMRMQVLRARVLTVRPRLVEIEVTDRLASAVAVRVGDAAAARRLPADAATTRVLALRRVGDAWLVARVSAGLAGR